MAQGNGQGPDSNNSGGLGKDKGTPNDDTVQGSPDGDLIDGREGNDWLEGSGGHDSILGASATTR